MLQTATFVFLILCLIGGFVVPTEARPEGGTTLAAFGCFAAAFAALVVLFLGRRRSAAAWGGLLVLGLAARLLLIHPVWLQYVYVRIHEFRTPERMIAAGILLVQAGMVFYFSRGTLRSELRRVSAAFGPRGVLPGVLLFAATAAHWTLFYAQRHQPSNIRWMILQFLSSGGLVVLDLLNIRLFALSIPESWRSALSRRFLFLLDPSAPSTRLEKLWPWIWGLFAALMAGVFAHFVFRGVPVIPDALAYHFQATCYAAGRLGADLPEVPEAFRVYLITPWNGQLTGVTHPGWPLVLALGVLSGFPEFTNAVLGGLTVVAVYFLTRRLDSRRAAGWITVLLAVSPWFLWLAASQMTHTVSLFLVVTGWLGVAAIRDGGPKGSLCAFAGGLCFGYLCGVRPLDGLITGALTGIWLLVRRERWPGILFFAAGCVAGTIPLLWFNHQLTGSITEFPLNTYINTLWSPGANDMGFGPDIGNPPDKWGILDPLPGHSWPDVLFNTNQNLYFLNFETLGFGFGTLFLVLFGVLGNRREHDRPLAIFLVVLYAVYSAYWFSGGPDFGARYWFLMLFPVLWFATRGITRLIDQTPSAGGSLLAVLFLLIFATTSVFNLWRAEGKYRRYRGFHSEYADMKQAGTFGARALVFVNAPNDVDYGCAFILNPLNLDNESPIFVRDLDPLTNSRVARSLPGRHSIRVDGPSATGCSVRVIDQSGLDMGMGKER